MLLPERLATILAAINLGLSLWRLIQDTRNRRPMVLFWIASLYVAGIPLLVDSALVLAGHADKWGQALSLQRISFPYDLSGDLLLRIVVFVLAFNAIVAFSAEVARRLYAAKREPAVRPDQIEEHIPSMRLLVIMGWLGLGIYGLYGMRRFVFGVPVYALYILFTTFSSAGVFLAIIGSRRLWALIGAAPAIVAAYVSTTRPVIATLIGCTLLGLLARYKGSLFRILVFLGVGGLAMVFVLNTVLGPRAYQKSYNSFLYPLNRDESVNNLYFCFDEEMLDDPGTEFAGIKCLLATGFVPESLFGARQLQDADVTWYLAACRFFPGWGTLHPTIYGWSFVDMKWYGLGFAAFFGLLVSALTEWSQHDFARRAVVAAVASKLIIVGVRGSVQVGYSSLVYALVGGMILCSLAKHLNILKLGLPEAKLGSGPQAPRERAESS